MPDNPAAQSPSAGEWATWEFHVGKPGVLGGRAGATWGGGRALRRGEKDRHWFSPSRPLINYLATRLYQTDYQIARLLTARLFFSLLLPRLHHPSRDNYVDHRLSVPSRPTHAHTYFVREYSFVTHGSISHLSPSLSPLPGRVVLPTYIHICTS